MKANMITPVGVPTGYAMHGQFFADALYRNGVDLTVFPEIDLSARQAKQREQLMYPESIKKLVRKSSNTGWSLQDPTIRLEIPSGMRVMSGKGPTVYWGILEVSRIPKHWTHGLNQHDQVWTPSSWGKQMLIDSNVEEDKIRVVPEGVDSELFNPDTGVHPTLASDTNYKFLALGKFEKRKGYYTLLKAFAEEFKPKESVSLYVQSDNPFQPKQDFYMEAFKTNLPSHAKIQPFNVTLPTQRMPELYNSFDAFVLPTRGEAWGLPIIEAMSCELPVITTKVTGQADYVTEDNAYILRTKGLEQVDVPLPGFKVEQGMEWYKPDKKHLRYLLREVYENPDKASKKGKKAREDVKINWSWDNAARIGIECLEELV